MPSATERPRVLDRGFRDLDLMVFRGEAGIAFVIRLHQGAHPPEFFDDEGREVHLTLARGEGVIWRDLRYKGSVRVQVIGIWT